MSNLIFDPERWESVEAGDEAPSERWLVTEGDCVHAGQAHRNARTPRYTLGASCALGRTSSRHWNSRSARVEKSRNGSRTGFFSSNTRSPARKTHDMCVSMASMVPTCCRARRATSGSAPWLRDRAAGRPRGGRAMAGSWRMADDEAILGRLEMSALAPTQAGCGHATSCLCARSSGCVALGSSMANLWCLVVEQQ